METLLPGQKLQPNAKNKNYNILTENYTASDDFARLKLSADFAPDATQINR